jgi:hypothetical protein
VPAQSIDAVPKTARKIVPHGLFIQPRRGTKTVGTEKRSSHELRNQATMGMALTADGPSKRREEWAQVSGRSYSGL